MSKDELINHYEKHLEKVKIMHNVNNARSELERDKCQSFVDQAEKDLEEVRNGREW